MEKLEALFTIGGNINDKAAYETVWWFFKKLKAELSHDPATPPGQQYPKALKEGLEEIMAHRT